RQLSTFFSTRQLPAISGSRFVVLILSTIFLMVYLLFPAKNARPLFVRFFLVFLAFPGLLDNFALK
ncbi:hypothetical protein HMPREF1990_01037, partial [Porphyromonas gingivalis W4087]